MIGCMSWDPNNRFSCAKCLQHPYFATSSLPTEVPQEKPAPPVPRPTSKSELNRSIDRGQPPKPPPLSSGLGGLKQGELPPVQAKQQTNDWAGNFLLNNLNSTKSSQANSGPNSRSGRVSLPGNKENSKPEQPRGSLGSLPPLQGAGSVKTPQSGSSRYLRMARYQPGMQQTPVPAASGQSARNQMPAPAIAPSVRQGLERPNFLPGLAGGDRDRGRQNLFGGAGAAMMR